MLYTIGKRLDTVQALKERDTIQKSSRDADGGIAFVNRLEAAEYIWKHHSLAPQDYAIFALYTDLENCYVTNMGYGVHLYLHTDVPLGLLQSYDYNTINHYQLYLKD